MLRAIPFIAVTLTLTGSFVLEKAGNYGLESLSEGQDIHFFETHNEVKWRDRKSFYWHDVSKDFRTSQPGRVQTLDESIAKVRLSDSHELLIAPNSVVEVDLRRKSLNLISGKIFINKIPTGNKRLHHITINDQPLPSRTQEQESVVFFKESETQALQILSLDQSPIPVPVKVAKIEALKDEVKEKVNTPTAVAPKREQPRKIVVTEVKKEIPLEQTPEPVIEPPVLPKETSQMGETSDWNFVLGTNIPLHSMDIQSDSLGKAKGIIFGYPGIDASISQKKDSHRLRVDYSWNILRFKAEENVLNTNRHDLSCTFIFNSWGLGGGLLGRDILTLENDNLKKYTYVTPTIDLTYSLRTDTETKHIDTIAYLSSFFYALPLSGQAMDISGWRVRIQSHFLNKKKWWDYQIGPTLGIFYESTSADYSVDNDKSDFTSKTFGMNVGYSIKF